MGSKDKTNILGVRLTVEQRHHVDQAAALLGMKASEYARELIVAGAESDLTADAAPTSPIAPGGVDRRAIIGGARGTGKAAALRRMSVEENARADEPAIEDARQRVARANPDPKGWKGYPDPGAASRAAAALAAREAKLPPSQESKALARANRTARRSPLIPPARSSTREHKPGCPCLICKPSK